MKHIDFTNTEVASSETARYINRGVVLNLIRRRQPISRADLARASGLQRSTVSLITEELIRQKWVVYGPIGRLPRGRRPTFLRLNERRAILVVELRPGQTTIGVADVNGNFLSQEVMQTTSDPQRMAKELSARICHLKDQHPDLEFEGVGISLPGRYHEEQRAIFAPNLGWPKFDFKAAMEQTTRMRVELENAANACVLAEVWFGHMEKVRDFVVVTVSEGIGTGVFANGQLLRGRDGMAGEFGHVTLDPQGPPCACGGRGCWEVYGSNRAALRYYRELNPDAENLSYQQLLALADSGVEQAVKALERQCQAIARGITMLVVGLAPEEIVVVGELTTQWQRFGSLLEIGQGPGFLRASPPRIRPAEGKTARMRGSVALVLQKHFGPSFAETEDNGVFSRRGVSVS
jgi:predicted NBD/HSP70 family sugar kinase